MWVACKLIFENDIKPQEWDSKKYFIFMGRTENYVTFNKLDRKGIPHLILYISSHICVLIMRKPTRWQLVERLWMFWSGRHESLAYLLYRRLSCPTSIYQLPYIKNLSTHQFLSPHQLLFPHQLLSTNCPLSPSSLQVSSTKIVWFSADIYITSAVPWHSSNFFYYFHYPPITVFIRDQIFPPSNIFGQ